VVIMCGDIPPLPNTPSWRGAHIRTGTTLNGKEISPTVEYLKTNEKEQRRKERKVGINATQ